MNARLRNEDAVETVGRQTMSRTRAKAGAAAKPPGPKPVEVVHAQLALHGMIQEAAYFRALTTRICAGSRVRGLAGGGGRSGCVGNNVGLIAGCNT